MAVPNLPEKTHGHLTKLLSTDSGNTNIRDPRHSPVIVRLAATVRLFKVAHFS